MGDTVSELAQKLRPYWLRDTNSSIGLLSSGSAATMAAHALNGQYHTGQLAETQAAWAATKSELAAHAALPDAHHAQVHALVGSDHTASGLTAGYVVRASGATSFAWAQLGHGDLGGVTANQHHNQQHLITGADHTLTGSKWQIVGATADNTLGLLTPSAAPGAAEAILKSTSAGLLTLPLFAATTKVTSPLIDATANLSIQPTGDLTIDPAGGEVFIPGNRTVRSTSWTAGVLGTGWGIQERASGKSHLDIRSIYTDELIATTFTCDQVRVRSGSDWLGEAMAIAARDNSDAKVTIPAVGGGSVRIYVENAPEIAGQIFDANEYVLVKTIDRTSGLVIRETWGQVSSYNSETGARQSYAWTTVSGGGNFLLEPGTALIGFGASGGSYIFRTVIEAGRGPYERFATWATNPYTPANRTSRVEIGDIKNAVGDSTTRYGIAAGNNLALTPGTGFSGFSADNVNGMKLYNSVLELYSGTERRVWLTKDYGLYFGWSSTNVSSLPIVFSPDLDSASPGASGIISGGKSGIVNQLTLTSYSYTNTESQILLIATQATTERSRIQVSAAGTGSIYMQTTSYSFAKSGGGAPSFQIGGYEAWHAGNLASPWYAGNLASPWHAGNLTPSNYAALSGATFTGDVSVGIANYNTLFLDASTDGYGFYLRTQKGSSTTAAYLYLAPVNPKVALIDGSQAYALAIYNATDEKVRISSNGDSWLNGGNVWFGNTSDLFNAKIQTSGNIHAAGSITAEGFVQVKATTAPSNASGWARIFLRSSDNALCAVMPSGNVRVIVAN